jgi:hypothetical protein
MLPRLIANETARAAPAGDIELMGALTRTLVIIAGTMSETQQVAWIAAVAEEFEDLPGDLVLDALKYARRECQFPSQVVASVFSRAEPTAELRAAQLQKLLCLQRAIETTTKRLEQ